MSANFMVEISGTLTPDITVYIPKKYYQGNMISMSLVSEYFDGILRFDGVSNINCHIGKTRQDKPFVWIDSTSPKDQINIICNVDVEITRNYSLFGWLEYGARSLSRYLLNSAKQLCAPKEQGQ